MSENSRPKLHYLSTNDLMVQRFFSVAGNAFLETVRQPIYGVILFATFLLLVLNVSLAAFTQDDDNKLLLDIGLSTLLVSGLFLAAFSASGVFGREIENKTVLTVISKPIGRPVFILGKFAGLLAAVTLAFYLASLAFILAQRHGVLANTSDPWDGPVLVFGVGSVLLSVLIGGFCNYFYGKHFPSTVLAILTPLLTISVLLVAKLDKHWELIPVASQFVGGQVLIAIYLVFLIVMIMTSVALAASTRFGQLVTLMICTAALGLGVVSDYAFGQYAERSTAANIAYAVVPNIGPFWIMDGLMAAREETSVPLIYVGLATGYALLLTTAILNIGIIAFQKREVG